MLSGKTRVVLSLFLLLAMLGATYMASSQPPKEEQQLVSVFNRGMQFAQQGEIREAIEKLVEAEKLAPEDSMIEARIKYNIATILMELLREFNAFDIEQTKLLIDVKKLLGIKGLDEELEAMADDIDNVTIETINLAEFVMHARNLLIDALRISPQDEEIAKQLEIVNAWLEPLMEEGQGQGDQKSDSTEGEEEDENQIPSEPLEEKEYEKPRRRGLA